MSGSVRKRAWSTRSTAMIPAQAILFLRVAQAFWESNGRPHENVEELAQWAGLAARNLYRGQASGRAWFGLM